MCIRDRLRALHAATGLAKPTLLRILHTLERGGLVWRSIHDGEWRRAVEWGGGPRPAADPGLVTVAHPAHRTTATQRQVGRRWVDAETSLRRAEQDDLQQPGLRQVPKIPAETCGVPIILLRELLKGEDQSRLAMRGPIMDELHAQGSLATAGRAFDEIGRPRQEASAEHLIEFHGVVDGACSAA